MPIVQTSVLPLTMATKAKAQRVRVAVVRHLEPMSPAMSEPAVVDKHARAPGPHHGRAGLHHRPGRLHGTAGTAQENIHAVAIDRRQFVFHRRPPAGRSKDLGKLIIRRHGAKIDLRGVRQDERLARQAATGRQALDQFFRMRPLARNAESNRDRGGWVIHL
jgi:hypothetical protein